MKPPATVVAVLFLLGSTLAHAQLNQNSFKHVVVIVQENRTPDNIFGSNPNFEPGVDIATSGLNSRGKEIPLRATALAGCYDLSHMHSAFVQMYDNGKMDGADKVQVQPNPGCELPPTPQFKYLDNSQGTVQPYFDLASQYGFANRMFQTNQGPSFPAHQFLLSGTSAPTTNSNLFAAENVVLKGEKFAPSGCTAPADATVQLIDSQGHENSKQYPCFEHPTLTDLLDNAPNGAIDWRYYTNSADSLWTAPNAIKHMCVPKEERGHGLVCTGSDWVDHVVLPQTKVLKDINNCDLAPVTWVTPDGADSDHAGINLGKGPSWVASIVNEIGNSSCGYWQNTAILITWDDWGGWYDHVPPFQIGQFNGWGTGYVYGFRVPLLVVSAYTPQGYVDNSIYDFGSILVFIENNFGSFGQSLGLIGPGYYADAYASGLDNFFTLREPRQFQVILAPYDANYFIHRNVPPLDADDDGDED
jgi:phospholipase C